LAKVGAGRDSPVSRGIAAVKAGGELPAAVAVKVLFAVDVKIRELIRIVREFDREEYEAVLFFAKTIEKLRTQKRR
jgi:hypothetical protein